MRRKDFSGLKKKKALRILLLAVLLFAVYPNMLFAVEQDAVQTEQIAGRVEPVADQAEQAAGRAEEAAGRIEQAADRTEEAAGQKADDSEAIYSKAGLLLRSGLYAEAKEEFEKLLRIEPEHQGALDGMMEAQKGLFEAGVASGAAKQEEGAEYARGKKSHDQKEFLETNYKLAVEFFKKENLLEAKNYLQKVTEVDPDYKDALELTIDIVLAMKKKEEDAMEAQYTLGPGDVVELYVQDQPDMSGEVTIQPGGELVLRGINEIVIANDIPRAKLIELIEQRIKRYIKYEPKVQLVVKEYKSKKWYILGEVSSQGSYEIGKPELTLLEALYQADLPREGVAAMRRIHVIHPDKDNPARKSINAYALLYEGDMSQNVIIHPGDIIYVPKTVIRKITETIVSVTSPLSPYATTIENLETINTVPPVTRVGSGPGQVGN